MTFPFNIIVVIEFFCDQRGILREKVTDEKAQWKT